ncbi:MAG: DUF6232 family protein [Hyphomicrobiaceae bacterium]|nr:DUF6232 family protein [Hyphomicrobiaceae bacterium]
MSSGGRGDHAEARLVLTSLGIDRRVLSAGPRTIPLANIAGLTVGPYREVRSPVWPLAGLGLATYGLAGFAGQQGSALLGAAGAQYLVLVVIGLAVLAGRLRPGDRTVYLIVAANDGTRTLFTGDRAVLERVRQIIARKIDAADEVAAFAVDFERGSIETIAAGSLDPALTREQPARSGAGLPGGGLPAGGAPATASANGARPTARDSGRWVGEPTPTQTGPPGATGRGGAPTLARVDYSQVIGDVATLRAYFAEDPGAGHIAARLDELERLMREGTPSPASRIRLRDVAADLAAIMASTPQWAQVFAHIARMSGM